MNKNPTRTALLAILTVFLASQAFAQITLPYPYIVVTPAAPAANKDSITLKLNLGTASNGCMAPTFTGQNFTIVPSMLTIYPPQFNVAVTYTTVPLPPGKMCTMEYNPVQYGPVFKLGKLALGTYYVSDGGKYAGTFSVGDMSFSNSNSTVWQNATFTVATDKAVYFPTDSLAVRYTITNNSNIVTQSYGPFGGLCEYELVIRLKDGIELLRESANSLCLPDIINITVLPGATVIKNYPKFGYPDGIDAFVATLDSVMLTVSVQLRGAKYDSTRAGVDVKIKRNPTAIRPVARSMAMQGTAVFTSSGMLKVSVPSRQKVFVRAFSTDGRVLPGISFSKTYDAGTHIIPMNKEKCVSGVSILHVNGETFGAVVRMISGMVK
jgi:hypothetical protein